MSSVAVLGAGVVGQAYAGLLSEAGHDVTLIARGARATRMRTQGIVLDVDGRTRTPRCQVVGSVAEAGTTDVLIVAVRGDQLAAAQEAIAESRAPLICCLTNPLNGRDALECAVGPERVVFGFSGVGGRLADDGTVHIHVVRQQPTVVDIGAQRGEEAAQLFRSTGLAVRAETQIGAWLTTHTLFIAAVGAAVLRADAGEPGIASSAWQAQQFVAAVDEAFRAVQVRGERARPAALRVIFSAVPHILAARYWRRQFTSSMVQVAIAPHVRATARSEFPQLVRHALTLVGTDAPRFREFVEPVIHRAGSIASAL